MQLRSDWRQFRIIEKLAVILIIASALLEIWWTLAASPQGDASNHIYRFELVWQMWRDGVLYPRWLPASFNGYGSPTFYFYPPFVYFAAGILHVLISSLTATMIYRVLTLLISIVSFFSFLFFLKSKHFSFWISSIGSLLYAFAPYRYLDANVRGALAEHAAFIWVPLLLWGVDRIRETIGQRDTAFLAIAIAWAAILMTNIPAAAVVGCGILPYIWISPFPRSPLKYRTRILLGMATGTLLAAVSLLPALQFGAEINQALFGQPAYTFGNSNTPLLDIFSGRLITINFIGVLTVGAIFFLLPDLQAVREHLKGIRTLMQGYRIILWLVLMVQLPYVSILLFKYFKPAVLVQFPWRFDLWVIPIAAIGWVYCLNYRIRARISAIVCAWQSCTIIIIALNLAGFSIHSHVRELDPTWEYFVPRWVPIANGAPATTANIHPPVWAEEMLPSESIQNIYRGSFNDSIQVTFKTVHAVKFHRYYWPQWVATVDGIAANTYADSNGYATIQVPAGRHVIALTLHKSRSEVAGFWISCLTALGLGGYFIVNRACGTRHKPGLSSNDSEPANRQKDRRSRRRKSLVESE